MAALGALTLKFSGLGVPAKATPGHPAFSIAPTVEATGQRSLATWLDITLHPVAEDVVAAGYFAGSVLVSGTPVPYATVRLYYRLTGVLIASAKASAAGTFQFDGIPTASSEYFIIAFDPDGGVLYNAAIFDRITAVT